MSGLEYDVLIEEHDAGVRQVTVTRTFVGGNTFDDQFSLSPNGDDDFYISLPGT